MSTYDIPLGGASWWPNAAALSLPHHPKAIFLLSFFWLFIRQHSLPHDDFIHYELQEGACPHIYLMSASIPSPQHKVSINTDWVHEWMILMNRHSLVGEQKSRVLLLLLIFMKVGSFSYFYHKRVSRKYLYGIGLHMQSCT